MLYEASANGRLWLIGGTSESSHLAVAIAQAGFACTISVTTETARSLYPDLPLLRVWVGRLDLAGMGQFLLAQNIVAVLDASHPYAVEVSRNAIAICSQFNLPYLRFQRPSLVQKCKDELSPLPITNYQFPITNFQFPITNYQLIHLDSFNTLVTGNYLQGQRVLLTVGYQVLPLFRSWQAKATLFARLLPASNSIEAALAAGFTADKLFAMRPPIPADIEKALWQYWQISMVVTKASGKAGGEDIKRRLAAELGISLVIIDAPVVDYPQVTSDVGEAIEFCRKYLC